MVPMEGVVFHRLVTGRSVDDLNEATRGLGGKAVQRVLDRFVVPLAYEHQLDRARQASDIINPPSARELAQKLAGLSLKSLREPITLPVLDVEHQDSSVKVIVDYREQVEERQEMAAAIREELWLPEDYDLTLGDNVTAITVINSGHLPQDAVARIANRVPDNLQASPTQPIS